MEPPPQLAGRVVLTHHWLVRRRGGERVLEALAQLAPGAPIYTLVHDAALEWEGRSHPVHASCLQRLPGALRHYPRYLPLMPWAARRVRLPAADLVVCSDACLAKAMRPAARSRVICYCHSPMRYVWEPQVSRQYAATLPPGLRAAWPMLCAWLRRVDTAAAARVDLFVANSQHVAGRIRRAYGRDATVIYPPVDVPPVPPAPLPREDFYLCAGHHVAYKRLDLAVDACVALGRRLVVIGDGPEAERLARAAPPGVTWLGHQPVEVLHDAYGRAAGLLFPGEEDFGIVPVEALAHGCPVIAYGVGGAAESVTHGVSGVLFNEQTVEALRAAILLREQLRFDPAALHAQALRFRRAHFQEQMAALMLEQLARAQQPAAG